MPPTASGDGDGVAILPLEAELLLEETALEYGFVAGADGSGLGGMVALGTIASLEAGELAGGERGAGWLY
jgi:hypothetical protein